MNRALRIGAAAALLATGALASVPARPAPPGSDLAGIKPRLKEATLAVVTYADDAVAIVADPAWLGRFQQLLSHAGSAPEERCFCVSFPRIELAGKDGKLFTVEFVHGRSVRFAGKTLSGQFPVDAETFQAAVQMLAEQRGKAISRPKPAKLPPPPPHVEIKPPDPARAP